MCAIWARNHLCRQWDNQLVVSLLGCVSGLLLLLRMEVGIDCAIRTALLPFGFVLRYGKAQKHRQGSVRDLTWYARHHSGSEDGLAPCLNMVSDIGRNRKVKGARYNSSL